MTIPDAVTRLLNGRTHCSIRSSLVLVVGLAGCLAGCGSGAPRDLSVFPMPGSRVAAPQTEIVLRGASVSSLGRIVVTGSRSGRHSGRLLRDSDKNGASFLPRKPFLPGERVMVRVRPSDHSIRGKRWQFSIAQPAGSLPDQTLAPAPRIPGDVLSFTSRPDLKPAAVQIDKGSSSSDGGDVFLAPQEGPVQDGPMIISPSGSLVWFKPLPPGDVADDFRVQHYRGKPVLTWWQGYEGAGVGIGEDEIYDTAYRQIAVVRAGNGLAADLHEFLLTRQGTAFITAYHPVYWDGTSIHGPRRMLVLDSVVQEIDIKTGLVLFQWDSLDHIPLSDSYEPRPASPGQPYDYFHINSIQQDRDGNLIISARNTWAVYKIQLSTGKTLWTLGGKHSSFRLSRGAAFAFQHDVRVRGHGLRTATLFDDGAGPPIVHGQSRGLTLRLDPSAHRASVVKVDEHSPQLLTNFEGSVQQLPNGDQFLGWGQQPFFTEFDAGGKTVFEGRFIDANESYRAYRYKWSAKPATTPALATSSGGGETTVSVSWNGATGVAAWRILAGASRTSLSTAKTVPKQGFETRVSVPAAPYLAAQALDARGHVLATSSPVGTA
jgi:hypothetical protein